MKPSKFIRPNECLTVAEIYRRQFGGTTTLENYGVYIHPSVPGSAALPLLLQGKPQGCRRHPDTG